MSSQREKRWKGFCGEFMTKITIRAALCLCLSVGCSTTQNNSAGEEHVKQAEIFRKDAKPDSAVMHYEKAAAEFKASGNMEGFINACNQIGIILTRQDKYEKAKTFLDQALSAGLSLPDSNHLLIATTYISLGVVYNAEEKYTQSLEAHHKALSIRLLKLGENHADVATSYGNLGNVYLNSQDYDRSIEAHLKAMKIRQALFGETGVEVIQSFTNLGNAHREKGDFKVSLEYFEKGLKSKIIQRGEGHKDLAKFYKNISDVYYQTNDKEKGDLYKAKGEACTGT